MEDSSRQKIFGLTPRGSCTPGFEVWTNHEGVMTLSDLLEKSARERQAAESSSLNLPKDSNVSPDDALLGSDLRKLFRENSITSPSISSDKISLENDSRNSTIKIVPSPCTSPTKFALPGLSQPEPRIKRTITNDSFQEIHAYSAKIPVYNESKGDVICDSDQEHEKVFPLPEERKVSNEPNDKDENKKETDQEDN